jgi:5'(3')-deoxyribonucleotidase
MPVILLDVDGLLRDFATPALGWAHLLGADRSITADTLTTYDIASLLHHTVRERWLYQVSKRGFCASLKPYPGTRKLVEQLRELGDVVAVTAPMPGGATWESESRAWLREHFGFQRDDVLSGSGKHWVGGDFFADDTATHLASWAFRWEGAHPSINYANRCFLIERPYNVDGACAFPRGSLGDFVTYVRGFLQARRHLRLATPASAAPTTNGDPAP